MSRRQPRINEQEIAKTLRDELFLVSKTENNSQAKVDLSQIETISASDKSYISPIFAMNEDEILNFVEEFNVGELATLSVAELNHIGKVLGVDPKILVEGED